MSSKSSLIWSKYNLLFRSDRFGLLLYNSLTNRILTISPEFECEIQRIKSDPMGYDYSGCLSVFTTLLHSNALIGADEERGLIESLYKQHHAAQNDTSRLVLTILVTEDCNFGCPYCYEKDKRSVDMSSNTVARLKDFITTFLPLEKLDVIWFGGEPLLRFDIVRDLSRWFVEMRIPFSASIVTNGWGLTEEVTRHFEEMRIQQIQVTLDGPPSIHNARRFHLEHGDSHHVIQANLDRLMLKARWRGKLRINYVVDEANANVFDETYDYWSKRYPESDVKLKASFRDKTERGLLCPGSFSREQEINFSLQQFRRGRQDGLTLLPKRNGTLCLAACRNAFVVGAEGQLYKCLDDVGKKEMEIGCISSSPKKWNTEVVERYRAAGSFHESRKCRACFYLPICTPCPNIQYRAKYLNQKISPCPPFKHRLPELLEIRHARALEQALSDDGLHG